MALYDGIAEWYDRQIVNGPAARWSGAALDLLEGLVGRGPGRCLDLCCGGGLAIPRLVELGWAVTGIDLSADQLAVARGRAGPIAEALVHGDATALPFDERSFDAVIAVLAHTDMPDWRAAVTEAGRVLRPGGAFVQVGVHPCFNSPCAERTEHGRLVHPGYRDGAWVNDGPGIGQGIRRRVGTWHLTVSGLVHAVLDAGLVLERLDEGDFGDPPELLGLRARRPA
jgi:SAM-dependent methyltransferase